MLTVSIAPLADAYEDQFVCTVTSGDESTGVAVRYDGTTPLAIAPHDARVAPTPTIHVLDWLKARFGVDLPAFAPGEWKFGDEQPRKAPSLPACSCGINHSPVDSCAFAKTLRAAGVL